MAVSAVLLAILWTGFRMAGWLGGSQSLIRITWRSDGPWSLTVANGGDFEAYLTPSVRMSPFAIWLTWNLESGEVIGGRPRRWSRTLLLLPWDVYQPDFRRLLVRLRLDRSECAPTAAQANS